MKNSEVRLLLRGDEMQSQEGKGVQGGRRELSKRGNLNQGEEMGGADDGTAPNALHIALYLNRAPSRQFC